MGGEQQGGGLGFGRVFTNHMAVATYRGGAWSPVAITPHEALTMSPAAMVFHYGQAVFEGLKAFRQPDGSVALFRPDENAKRFDASAARLAMPALPPGMLTQACERLVEADERWVPSAPGESLYLRPMMLATEAALGVRPSTEYLFAVIASPVGAYFSEGVRPIEVWATDRYVRASPGGTGAAKCAGNYAASLAAKAEATANGCDETLFLDAAEHRWLEELGGMNVVLVADGAEGDGADGPTLVTPPTQGTILDGITRKSLLQLAPTLGLGVVERPVSIEEVCDGTTFSEAFACGTAAVIAPIGAVRTASGMSARFGSETGPVTARLRQALVDLQEGRAADPFGWRVPVRPTVAAP